MIAKTPMALIARVGLKINTVDELVRHARQASKTLTLGFTGGASLQAFAAAAFTTAARIDRGCRALPRRSADHHRPPGRADRSGDHGTAGRAGSDPKRRPGDARHLVGCAVSGSAGCADGERVSGRKGCHRRNLGRSGRAARVASRNRREDQPCGARCPDATRRCATGASRLARCLRNLRPRLPSAIFWRRKKAVTAALAAGGPWHSLGEGGRIPEHR